MEQSDSETDGRLAEPVTLDPTNRRLALVTAVLVLATAVQVVEDSRPPETLWSTGEILEPAVQSIGFATSEGQILIERTRMGWRLTEPEALSADKAKVEALLRDWSPGLTPDLKLMDQASTEDDERYGLSSENRTTLQIKGKTGSLVDLEIGTSIAGGSAYLRQAGSRAVFRGKVPGLARLKVDPTRWRDMGLFAFEKDEVLRIELDGVGEGLSFTRTASDDAGTSTWTARKPENLNVSSRKIDLMVRSLANLKARQIIEGEALNAVRGAAAVDSPRITVRVETRDGKQHALLLGAEEDPNHTVYASVEGREGLFVLPVASYRQFDKTPADVRDMTVLKVERSVDTRVRFVEGDRRVLVGPEGERDWKVLDPADFGTPDSELKLAMHSLTNLQAAEIRSETSLPTDPLGPRFEISDGDNSQTLRLATGKEGEHLATVDGRNGTYVLRNNAAERLLRVFRKTPATPGLSTGG